MKKLFFLLPLLFNLFYNSLAAKNLPGLYFPVNITTAGTVKIFSSPTDHFRSKQIGDWSDVNTWETSPDAVTWTNATLIPANAANTISIGNSHTVTVSTSQDMDQVFIYNGAILEHTGGVLTIHDGAGDDLTVINGGVFTLLLVGSPPVFLPVTANATIKEGGILKVAAGGMTGNGTGVNAANYIYQNGSILELKVAFSTDGVTYFPNVAADTIPVFRSSTGLAVGASGTTVFNGLFEAAIGLTVLGSGQKIFRNGITGAGNIEGSGSGKFIINGNNAILGGSGLLTVPAATGMDIGNGTGTQVSLIFDKTITNNITLLNNSYVFLNDNNLTMNGVVSGGLATAHIVTGGLGKLIINNIGATPVLFPVGADIATITPLVIYDGSGLNYAVRVELGINPAIAVPVNAVNRTWFVTPYGGNPASVHVNFFYEAAHCNAGWSPPPATLELGLYSTVWNVIQTGLTQAGAYQVPTVISVLGDGIEAPLVLANIGAILATDQAVSVNYFNGVKRDGKHILNWQLRCNQTTAVKMILQHSTDGLGYSSLYSIFATALHCQQPFNYTDIAPANGINYYRLKMTDAAGKITYSLVVTLINAGKGMDVMNIAPNPIVNGAFNVKISTAEKTQMELVITDMQGRVLQMQRVNLIAGFNAKPMNVKNLAAGTYQFYGNTADGRTRVLRFVVQ